MRVRICLIFVGASGCLAVLGSLSQWGELTSTLSRAADETFKARADADRIRQFDAQIAPLLAKHCLECHDSTARKGGLDLSRREASLAGGESGKVVEPGQADESLLWQYVESGEMPKDRPPLADDEKLLLREWIDAGAVWSGESIDPLAYHRDRRAAYDWIQRLTVPEYIETVRSATGIDIGPEARRYLPLDQRADGFSNTAYNLTVDFAHVEAYARLARIIAARMDVMAFAAEHVSREHLDSENLPEAIAGVGKWLLRGPLEKHEVDSFLRVAEAVRGEGGEFPESLAYVVEAMLQSPRFIYRMERQTGEPVDERGTRSLDNYELASRLSYMVWGGPPDKELMRAADAGELTDRASCEAQVRRLLQDARAVERSTQFVYEWLDLDRLANMRPNSERFPNWDPQLAADMRDETLAYFRYVAWEQNRPLSDLMNAQATFVTPRLAAHYGLGDEHRVGASGGLQPRGPRRVTDGLVALYTFADGSGDVVRDVSGAGEPLDLKIEDTSAVEWKKDGLAVRSPTIISTSGPATRLIDAVKKSNAVTIEAWITPADAGLTGPARIVTLSADPSSRSFTLGQDGNKYDVRFRTTTRDNNGLPSMAANSGSVTVSKLTHVVYVRTETGTGAIYVDGEEQNGRDVDGNLSNWDDGFTLALANEITKDRPWRGTFHLVAIYHRALTADEIQSQGMGLAQYDLSNVPSRGGLLTQGSVLTVGGDEASTVARGLFVLHDLLYSRVGDPPADADTTPVPTKPGMSQRAIAETRLGNAACSGCHSKFEPLSFGLEKYDGIGAFHDVDEHGNKLRDDGEIVLPGETETVSYGSSAELMELLADSPRVKMNFTRKVTQFALGRPLVESDAPLVEHIHEAAQEGGGTYASLITAIVMSDLVQRRRVEAQ